MLYLEIKEKMSVHSDGVDSDGKDVYIMYISFVSSFGLFTVYINIVMPLKYFQCVSFDT